MWNKFTYWLLGWNWQCCESEIFRFKVFFRNATAKYLSKQFKKIYKSLVRTKIFQVSIDGPNINLKKFCEELNKNATKIFFHSLIGICVCSLYSVHGAIRSGVETTFWAIKETLKGAFHLLHDFPTRREDFEVVASSNKYPLYFCATRFVKNKLLADRLLEICDNMQSIIGFWNKLPKYKQPSCKRFNNVEKAVTDPLSEAKILCFNFICSLVEPSGMQASSTHYLHWAEKFTK